VRPRYGSTPIPTPTCASRWTCPTRRGLRRQRDRPPRAGGPGRSPTRSATTGTAARRRRGYARAGAQPTRRSPLDDPAGWRRCGGERPGALLAASGTGTRQPLDRRPGTTRGGSSSRCRARLVRQRRRRSNRRRDRSWSPATGAAARSRWPRSARQIARRGGWRHLPRVPSILLTQWVGPAGVAPGGAFSIRCFAGAQGWYEQPVREVTDQSTAARGERFPRAGSLQLLAGSRCKRRLLRRLNGSP
jgi:hypothetical protein